MKNYMDKLITGPKIPKNTARLKKQLKFKFEKMGDFVENYSVMLLLNSIKHNVIFFLNLENYACCFN